MALTHTLKIKSASGNFNGEISVNDIEIDGLPYSEGGKMNKARFEKVLSLIDLFKKINNSFGTIEEIEITQKP